MQEEDYKEQILSCLLKSDAPSLNISEIAKMLGISTGTVSKYCFFLWGKGLLKKRESGNTTQYYLSDVGRTLAEKYSKK